MKKLYLLILMFLSFFIFSCSISLEERNKDELYGSLLCKNLNRSVIVDSIASAKVTVTGPGIDYELSTFCAGVEGGVGYFYFEKIPVGKNRIISVQGYDVAGAAIEDCVIFAVVDINPGPNEINIINKDTSCEGYVYKTLFEDGVDISDISSEDECLIEKVIPQIDDCEGDYKRIDAESIACDYIDYKNNVNNDITVKQILSYILPETAYLKRLYIRQSNITTVEKPVFLLVALYSDGKEVDVTDEALWISTDETKVTVDSGEVKFSDNAVGSVEVYGQYTDGSITRKSPKALLNIEYQEGKSNYLYLENDKSSESSVDYGKHGIVVAAWCWGKNSSGEWYIFENVDEKGNLMRFEVPEDTVGFVIARGQKLTDATTWNGLSPYNKTSDFLVSNIGNNNTVKLNAWDNATGNWFYKNYGDALESYHYAQTTMEPSEDDTSLSSISINSGNGDIPLTVAKRVVYTVPYAGAGDDILVKISATSNDKGASVSIVPAVAYIDNGEYEEFAVTVTARDGNTEDYVVKIKRSNEEPFDSKENKKRCYVDDPEEKTVTFIYDMETWGENSKDALITIRGSFTTYYDYGRKKWIEDNERFTMVYDSNYNWYTLTLPYDVVKRPGYSGQPEYRFCKDYKKIRIDGKDFIDTKYVFNPTNPLTDQNMMVLFDNEEEERLEELAYNSENSRTIKKLEEFDLSKKEDKEIISNFRQIPQVKNLYRSYHPFYPTHESTPTEYERLQKVQELMETVGIKSDINLCNDRTTKAGNNWEDINGEVWEITIPEYYQAIIDRNSVLYVGDVNSYGGNGTVPSANNVYYNSDSDLIVEWIKQICGFVNDDNNQAPFLIHCEIGVDRTGVFSAIFAGLCGASWEEIVVDYEKSNRMGIDEFRDSNVLKYSFEKMLKVEDISKESNIKGLLFDFFAKSGKITQSELNAALTKLTK